jgi:peroxiredoxin
MNTVLYPILIDNKENAIKLEKKYARTYPIYYDEDKKVSQLLHQKVKLLKLGRMPGLLIVDKKGIVQFAYYGDSMKDIPENEELFEVLEKINT